MFIRLSSNRNIICKFHATLLRGHRLILSSPTITHRTCSTLTFVERFAKFGEMWYQSQPVQRLSGLLVTVHDYSSLPWYITIIICTTLFRTCLVFPFMIVDHHNSARLQNLRPEMDEFTANLKKSLIDLQKNYGVSHKKAKRIFLAKLAIKRRELYIRENVHPGKKLILFLFQFPIWVSMSSSLSFLCYFSQFQSNTFVFESLTKEGALWFKNLTQPDQKYILPFLFGFSMFANLKVFRHPTVYLYLNHYHLFILSI